MSVFISSKVNLPSSCEKCPFNYADMSVGICMAADKTIDTRTYGRNRHPDCPLVEIPTPHGRLIDADELIGYLNEWLSDSVALFGFTRIINHQPTIIEAEVNQNERNTFQR